MKKHRHRPRPPQKGRRHKVVPTIAPRRDGPVYYRGGRCGRPLGFVFLPTSETGAIPLHLYGLQQHALSDVAEIDVDDAVHDPTAVYITTNLRIATYYALINRSGRGSVYIVEPDGEIAPDMDSPDRDDCFRCSRAKVIGFEKLDAALASGWRKKIARGGFKSYREVAWFQFEHGVRSARELPVQFD